MKINFQAFAVIIFFEGRSASGVIDPRFVVVSSKRRRIHLQRRIPEVQHADSRSQHLLLLLTFLTDALVTAIEKFSYTQCDQMA